MFNHDPDGVIAALEGKVLSEVDASGMNLLSVGVAAVCEVGAAVEEGMVVVVEMTIGSTRMNGVGSLDMDDLLMMISDVVVVVVVVVGVVGVVDLRTDSTHAVRMMGLVRQYILDMVDRRPCLLHHHTASLLHR